MRIIRVLLAASALVSASTGWAAPKGLPIGPCLNIGNTFEVGREHKLGDGAVGPADFQRIRAAGFDTIRLPVRWDQRSLKTPPYTIEPAWLNQVQAAVDQALAAGLKVILNSHHFDPIHETPLAVQPWHTGVWVQIAERLKDYPNDRLWFELENEPHNKFDDSNLRAVIDPALAAVRKSNPTRPVIIGGEKWSGIGSLATLTLPNDANVYPTFHYYDPFDFTHQGASWVAPNIPPPGRAFGTQADAKLLEADVARIKAYTAKTGLIPFMGESGAYEKHIPLAQRVAYTKAVHDAFVPAGIPVCQWAYKNTFPFFDKASGKWLPGLRGALGLADEAAAAQPAPAAKPGGAAPRGASAAELAALAEIQKQLPGTLISDPTRIDWPYNGAALKVKPVRDAAIPGGGAARRYTIATKPANPWEAQTLIPLTAGIASGQTVTVGFYARTISSKAADGKGVIGVRFNQNSAPYPGFGDTMLSIGPEWQWYEVSGVAPRAIARDVATVALQIGGAAQELEIGQAIVIEGAPSIQKATAAPAMATSEVELPPQLQGQGTLINRPAERRWENSVTPSFAGSWQDRDEPKIWYGKATRYTVPAVGANAWDLGVAIPIADGIKTGDKLLIAVAARTESAAAPDGKAKVAIRVQGTNPPYDGFANNAFTVGPNWQLIRLKTVATRDFAPGSAAVALHFAGAVQTVDVGPVYVIKLP